MDKTKVRVNVIIPCFNESKYLPKTFSSLAKYSKAEECELCVILVDNGSTDKSRDIARSFGADVFTKPKATIGKLRNIGVSKVKMGDLLVFIDADILVTEIWMKKVIECATSLHSNDLFVTGYPYLPPDKASWLERHWFSAEQKNLKYINSGNLITTKSLFDMIGGFDESLKTGEDYDFCFRARKQGAEIVPEKDYKVYHLGYPKTLFAFFKREMWHGVGDCQTLSKFLNSKPAIISLLWGSSWILGGFFLFFSEIKFFGVLLLLLGGVPVAMLAKRRHPNWLFFPGNIIISFIYLGGRFMSLILALQEKIGIP